MTIDDTIVAQATPIGRGGIGVIRVSGPRVEAIAKSLLGKLPPPRAAYYSQFVDAQGLPVDIGIALYFPAPQSFTGEDVLELQGHGGQVVMEKLLQRLVQLGARLANPGEFSQRAFLNNKIDLTQAEAIADLIDSSSEQAARSAIRSLQGEFSQQIQALLDQLIYLRQFVEAAIDFPEEDIDFLKDKQVSENLQQTIGQVEAILAKAKQGYRLNTGLSVVLAGRPNVGKSTLLNRLSGRESAIVTAIPGTTRDVMREQILIDGLPLHIIDTAGLRKSEDIVEQEGIRRAKQMIKEADVVLFMVNAEEDPESHYQQIHDEFIGDSQITGQQAIIANKIDLIAEQARIKSLEPADVIYLSAKSGAGVDLLQGWLKTVAGFSSSGETDFIARRRHLDKLEETHEYLLHGQGHLFAGELLAEDLRLAQQALSEITGKFTSDDLLGKIFSDFCIGK